ncbi:MAG TPA: TonB-dependent receptor [Sphingopyxis sp.]|uniref:TonB-dependent receptor n=1 Tax=Sphingopyxis sp. TaxID=1908224 RepID=UPI002C87F91C|nr:TonB-dependent receptor [Sphingopyxis sp.]HWW57631.1 TonB-dependent receptor [Sphingopyxis sp.]
MDIHATIAHMRYTGAVSALAIALAAAPAHAQEDDAVSATPAANEIVVTAQKRNERLQDVPISITVVNPALLESTNARNFAELQGVVPGVFFHGNSGGGRTYITLRGATGLALNTGDEPVAIYVDDIYVARGVTVGMSDLLDLGTIEIVRGPQGTLQGRNATAGAILIRSADPTDEPSAQFNMSIADPREFRTQGAISGPLGEGIGARLALGYVNDHGWAFNPVSGKHIGGGESFQSRLVTTLESGDFNARIIGDYSWTNNQPAIFRYANTNFSPLPTGPLIPAGTATPNAPLLPADRDRIFKDDIIALDPGTDTTVKTGGIAAKLEYSFGNIDLVSVTGWRRAVVQGTNDSDGLATARMGYNQNDDRSSQWSQELRLQSSGDRRFSWILGLYFFDENQFYEDDIYNLRFSLPTNTVTKYRGNLYTTSYAGFADATFKVTDKLHVIGGIRYTRDEKRLDATIQPTNLDTNVTTTTIYAPPKENWTDTSYRAKLVYQPSRDLMLFAGYGRGFRAGGYNPFAVQPSYQPEINKSWEVGAKGNLLDRMIDFSIAAFQSDYSNLQLRAGVPTGGAIITNAAEARIKGVELELNARPGAMTRFSGNLAYTDAKFTSFPTARDTLDRPVDATGNKLPRTPKWQFFVQGEQDVALGDDLLLGAQVNYRWRDRIYFFFTDQTAQPWQDPSGGELGARLTLKPEDERWSFSIFGTNLTNARIINTAAVTFSYPQVGLNKPRVIGASAGFKF